jgi:hypothetical protein
MDEEKHHAGPPIQPYHAELTPGAGRERVTILHCGVNFSLDIESHQAQDSKLEAGYEPQLDTVVVTVPR